MDSFSTLIRSASHQQHTEVKTSAFMSALLDGRLGVDAYARYTEQLWFVHGALEEGGRRLTDDPVAGPFVQPELIRLPALERDPRPPARRGLARRPRRPARHPRVRGTGGRVRQHLAGRLCGPSLHPLSGRPLRRPDPP